VEPFCKGAQAVTRGNRSGHNQSRQPIFRRSFVGTSPAVGSREWGKNGERRGVISGHLIQGYVPIPDRKLQLNK